MDAMVAMDVGRQALFVLIKVISPLMFVALVVGLVVSLFQALTQIQEMTLSFVPKIIAVFLSLIVFMPFIGGQLGGFSEFLATKIISSEGLYVSLNGMP